MRLFLALLVFCSVSACADKSEDSKIETKSTNKYDSQLAERLGADEYGMRQYVMAFLKAGPNRDQEESEAVILQKAHRANISRLADEGKLSVAGPFMDAGEFLGLFIFNVTTIEEARALAESDPAIKAGRLVMELHPWYGSAALMQVNETHKTLSKPAN
jgi:uncharacterized protein